MSRKERYRVDAEYRAKVNKANRERHQRKMKVESYRKLCAARARVNNARAAIEHHEERLAFFHARMVRDLRMIRKQGPPNPPDVVTEMAFSPLKKA